MRAKLVGAVVVDGEHSEAGAVGRIAFVLGLREARAFDQPSDAALTGDALAERFVGREPEVDVQWGGGATLAEEGEDRFHGELLVGEPAIGAELHGMGDVAVPGPPAAIGLQQA